MKTEILDSEKCARFAAMFELPDLPAYAKELHAKALAAAASPPAPDDPFGALYLLPSLLLPPTLVKAITFVQGPQGHCRHGASRESIGVILCAMSGFLALPDEYKGLAVCFAPEEIHEAMSALAQASAGYEERVTPYKFKPEDLANLSSTDYSSFYSFGYGLPPAPPPESAEGQSQGPA